VKLQMLAGVAALVLLAGCANAGTEKGCATFIGIPPVLVNPAPGATGVPVTIGALTLSNAGQGETVALRVPPSTFVSAGPLVSAGTSTQSVTIPTLSAGTTYSVVVSGIPAGCGPEGPIVIASFTTQ
jgi:hypothetical protein